MWCAFISSRKEEPNKRYIYTHNIYFTAGIYSQYDERARMMSDSANNECNIKARKSKEKRRERDRKQRVNNKCKIKVLMR